MEVNVFEPWFNKVIVSNKLLVEEHIKKEQPNTLFDMSERISCELDDEDLTTWDVYVIINVDTITSEDYVTIQNLNNLLKDYENLEFESGVEYEMGNLRLVINRLKNTVVELVYCNRSNI